MSDVHMFTRVGVAKAGKVAVAKVGHHIMFSIFLGRRPNVQIFNGSKRRCVPGSRNLPVIKKIVSLLPTQYTPNFKYLYRIRAAADTGFGGGGGGTDGGCGWGWGRLLARYEKRGGGGGGAVGLWPDTRSGGGGGGVLSVYGPIRGAGGGGGGCCRILAQNEERGGGGGGCCWFLARYEGRGGGKYDRVSGGPGYSTVVEFMRADINRQRNRAAIL